MGGEVFRSRPDRPWGPPSLLYKGHCVSFPEGKTAVAWRWLPTPSRAEFKERVELYLYSLCGPSWPVTGWPLPLSSVFQTTACNIYQQALLQAGCISGPVPKYCVGMCVCVCVGGVVVTCGCVCKCGFCNVWVCVCVGFVTCGCFGNVCTCNYRVFVLFRLCIFFHAFV